MKWIRFDERQPGVEDVVICCMMPDGADPCDAYQKLIAAQARCAALEARASRQVQDAVNRFLGWKLPEDFAPDCGISFKREGDYEHPQWGRAKFEPVGTNLLTATQAKAMFEHCLSTPSDTSALDAVVEKAKRETAASVVAAFMFNHGAPMATLLECVDKPGLAHPHWRLRMDVVEKTVYRAAGLRDKE